MCGINGKLSWVQPPDPRLIGRMNDRLRHRGPDAEGVFTDGPIALGHRRLSVIDTSDAGTQPMQDTSGRYTIVFNGEIYNFPQLRAELVRKGARFASRTDTEVILEAYKCWGVDCVQRLNGMFAFALWDAPRQRLFLARDRLGKKPLFYFPHADGSLTFASEIKALRLEPAVPAQINLRALGQYLFLNYILSSEAILEGVRKLPAGHWMLVEQGQPLRIKRYWDLALHFQDKRRFRSEAEAAEALSALLQDAVRMRLLSDVPLGAFLSSGIDSASIVAAMASLLPAEDVKTYTIGFREPGYSELEGARETVARYGVSHYERVVDAAMADLLPKIVFYCDEPFADTSMIPMYYLAQFARESVTVCLSGDGGDELFAGYETYVADKLHHMTRWLPHPLVSSLRASVEAFWPVGFGKVSLDYKLRRFLAGHAADTMAAHYSWRQILNLAQVRALVVPELAESILEGYPLPEFRRFYAEVPEAHYLDRLMYVDIKTWLVDDILVKVDRTTMAHSLEARAPLLDYRLVEFAAALPIEMKLKAFRKKYLLRKSHRALLPPAVLKRRKAGFNAPIAHWFGNGRGNDVAGVGIEALAGEWFQPAAVHALVDEHRRKCKDNSLALLALVNLHYWKRCMVGVAGDPGALMPQGGPMGPIPP
jgi:asparagine synthase (glutamine-hydrolysing)